MKTLPKLPFPSNSGFDPMLNSLELAPDEGTEVTGRCPPLREGNPDLVRTNTVAAGQSPFGSSGPTERVKVICEVKGVQVEYASRGEIVGGFKMETATQRCMVFLIRRDRTDSNGQLYSRASIVVISDDERSRFQQKLDDTIQTIPYTTWGNKLNVILRVPAKLKCYGDMDPKPIRKIETSWVSYLFEEESASVEFQNALMDKRLLLSVKTLGTSRMHSGLSSMFSMKDKLCAMENLRLWQDDSSRGSVFAMIQCSSQFRNGYLAFYINGPYNTVHVTDHGRRRIKIKGLTIPVNGKGVLELHTQSPEEFTTRTWRRKKKHMVTGIKIDFDTVEDKTAFLEMFRKIKGPFFG